MTAHNPVQDEVFVFPSTTSTLTANTSAQDEKRRRAQSLVGTSAGRPDDDFYPTPPEATRALLAREHFDGLTWEPACGDGAICRVLDAYGIPYIATDLIDRGFGQGGQDFFQSDLRATNIITNPPYKLAEKFVWRALERTDGKVAMLCKLAFLEGAKRRKLFETTPLKSVYVFSKRLSMYRNGEKGNYASGMIAFAWIVWKHGHEGPPTLGWI
jgi:hypothetical protein